jgi:hypothetical protein
MASRGSILGHKQEGVVASLLTQRNGRRAPAIPLTLSGIGLSRFAVFRFLQPAEQRVGRDPY